MPQEVDQWKEDANSEHFIHNLFMKNSNIWSNEHDWVMTLERFKEIISPIISPLQSKIKEQSYHNEQKEIVLQEWINNYRKLESEITAKDQRIKELEREVQDWKISFDELYIDTKK